MWSFSVVFVHPFPHTEKSLSLLTHSVILFIMTFLNGEIQTGVHIDEECIYFKCTIFFSHQVRCSAEALQVS